MDIQIISKLLIMLLKEPLLMLLKKGWNCFGAFSLLILLEVLFIIFCVVLEKKGKTLVEWIGIIIIPIFLCFSLYELSQKCSSLFENLYNLRSLSLITGLFSFGILNILLDMPSWREGMETYSLTPLGKRIKYFSSLSILAFTTGIIVWQHIQYNGASSNFLLLLWCILLIGFLPFILIMGIADIIQKQRWFFNKFYKKDKKIYIVHIHGKTKVHK
ncbi:hypothetical protein FOD75_11185 (plasmid) [Limosilactobacillus reuteri]|uniref:Uncharacterized protein n=1 Tax=Limosilactobacillus reuteri TaxID=1598 RepID=A0A517D8G5_LIMRT|nr:hypothetical protein [Limosilactobacillus reuteri]QDR73650.1 hypothetical protein FOD75_11185 [Limosilactobacillus reuteri]